MDTARTSPWLGYQVAGGRLELDSRSLVHGLSVLGRGSKELLCSLAYSLNEASSRVAVIDTDGELSKALSGHLEAYDASYVLHDCMLMDENGPLQAMLIASAYATVLDLPGEQEALLNATLQSMALEQGEASPAAIVPTIATVEGFKGPEKSEVSGRLGTLRLLESAGDAGAVAQTLRSSCVIDFSQARSRELAEASVALFIAKLLSAPRERSQPEVVILSEAQRLFRAHKIPRHVSTLRSALLSASFGVVFSSTVGHSLDRNLVDACALRLYSCETWNAGHPEMRVTPNMFVMQNHSRGTLEPFVLREFEPKSSGPRGGSGPPPSDGDLARIVLELVETWPTATKASVVSYLSAEHASGAVSSEIERLQSDGSLILFRPALGTDTPAAVLRVTEVGRLHLKELRENGETPDPV